MILPNVPNADYHARREVSKSGLDLIARSPAHFKHGRSSIAADTARIGSATHAMVLERGAGVVTGPSADKRRGAGADAWSAFFAEHSAQPSIVTMPAAQWLPQFEAETGLIAVTPGERTVLEAMAASVRAHPVAGPLLEPPGEAELSIIGEIDDVPARARPDWWTEDRATIVDLKTSADASRHKFRSSVATYRYHVQHAVYTSLAAGETGILPRFVFVVVEKTAPHAVAVYQLDDDAVANGEYLMSRDLETYARCIERNRWPSYDTDFALDIPIYDAEPEIAITMNGEAT